MPLKLISLAAYLTRTNNIDWSDDDHNASKFIKSIKGEPIKGWATIAVCGQHHRLNSNNQQDVFAWFGQMAADRLRRLIKQPIALTPIPSSGAHINTDEFPHTTMLLAESIVEHLGKDVAVIDDLLRWDQPMASSRHGGPRDPENLYSHLTLLDDAVYERPYVLIDDVCTTGGHLQACAAKLRDIGASVILAVCAGRSVHEQRSDPFDVPDEIYPDFFPSRRFTF